MTASLALKRIEEQSGVRLTPGDRKLVEMALAKELLAARLEAAQAQQRHDAGWLEQKSILHLGERDKDLYKALRIYAQQMRGGEVVK